MINLLNNNLPYAICFILVLLVGLYFAIIWLTRETVRDELRAIQHRRNKKRKQMFLKRQQESKQYNNSTNRRSNNPQSDVELDSYIDPAERYETNENDEDSNDSRYDEQPSGYSGTRLDKGDISMRDIADGVR